MKSERKHTQGPWRIEDGTTVIWSDNAYDSGTNSVGCIVARAAHPSTFRSSRPTADEQDANARLIAAAPDLLEALKAFVDMIEDSMSGSFHRDVGPFVAGVTDLELRPDGSFKLSDARAAITKAEGRS